MWTKEDSTVMEENVPYLFIVTDLVMAQSASLYGACFFMGLAYRDSLFVFTREATAAEVICLL